MDTTQIKMTPTMKRVLERIHNDTAYGRQNATGIALSVMPTVWDNRTLDRYVYAIMDIAKAGLIREHDMGWFHSIEGMCIDCDPEYN